MALPTDPIRLHRHPLSGHCHRVELFCGLLGLPVDLVPVDLLKGEHRTPEYLALNPFGQLPTIEDGAVRLADSNAILVYLAGRYDDGGTWYPGDPLAAAQVQRWLSVAAGQLAAGPAAARVHRVFGVPLDHARAVKIAEGLFGLMDGHLAGRSFLAGEGPTIADVALFTYTAAAPEGGVSLAPYPHVRAWLARVEALPGFVAMQAAPKK